MSLDLWKENIARAETHLVPRRWLLEVVCVAHCVARHAFLFIFLFNNIIMYHFFHINYISHFY